MSNLFIFNPTNEMAIADGGNGFMPSQYLADFEQDLEVLPFVLAHADDIVLVTRKPDAAWIESLALHNNPMPRFLDRKELIRKLKEKSLDIDNICPWGWSPRMIKLVEEIVSLSPTIDKTSPNLHWSAEHKEMYGRDTALKVLEKIIKESPNKSLLISEEFFPTRMESLGEISRFFAHHKRIVVKAPHSSSGRGIVMLSNPELNRSNYDWIQRAIRQSGYVMVEPFLNVVAEFSMQFHIDSRMCKFLALGALKTNEKGGYEGNFVGGLEITSEVSDFLALLDIPQLTKRIANALKEQNIGHFYHGYLGVDMLLCRKPDGALFMQPCSEINTRQNMGLVAFSLSSWLSPGSFGMFKIIRKSAFESSTLTNYLMNNPAKWENGLLKKGVFAITPLSAKQHIAILEVDEPTFHSNVFYFNSVR